MDLSVVDPDGAVVKTWTLTHDHDVIGANIGGGNLGWVRPHPGPGLLAIDNSRFNDIAAVPGDCMGQGWTEVLRRDATVFEHRGDCIQYVKTGK